MNINVNVRNKKKIGRKIKGVTYKMSYISASY